MLSYLDLLEDKGFLELLDNIEEKCHYAIAHGFKHVSGVIKHAQNLADIVNLSEYNKQLLLIAACLHDVGRKLHPEPHHNRIGANMVKEMLKGKLNSNEIDIISQAIYYHDKSDCDFEKMDDIAFCLVIADVMDFESNRLIKEWIKKDESFDLFSFTNKVFATIENNNFVLNVEYNNKKVEEIITNKCIPKWTPLFNAFAKHFKLNNVKFNLNLMKSKMWQLTSWVFWFVCKPHKF